MYLHHSNALLRDCFLHLNMQDHIKKASQICTVINSTDSYKSLVEGRYDKNLDVI